MTAITPGGAEPRPADRALSGDADQPAGARSRQIRIDTPGTVAIP